ncbi:MAG: ribosome maturation factor RimP [Acidimicrobiia bacterium]
MSLTEQISDMISPTIKEAGVRIWDINLTKAGKKSIVTITLDKNGGLTIDDISELSRQIAPVLDTIETLGDSYHLEVSSPGLERSLKNPDHFSWSIGFDISVSCRKDGTIKRYSGKLEKVENGYIKLQTQDGPIEIEIDSITKSHTLFDFDNAIKRAKDQENETDDEQLQGEIA